MYSVTSTCLGANELKSFLFDSFIIFSEALNAVKLAALSLTAFNAFTAGRVVNVMLCYQWSYTGWSISLA